jgi:hypothetical protein
MQKHLVILAVGLTLSTVGGARAAGPALDSLVACAGISDSAMRLACFDREVAPLARAGAPAGPTTPPRAALPLPVPGPTVPKTSVAREPAAATPTFGNEQLSPEQRPASTAADRTLHARLTSQKSAGGGFTNLYLDNGQVWRHQDQVLGGYLRDGDAVTIEKGALGSYKLSRDAGKSRNWIRVTRVR